MERGSTVLGRPEGNIGPRERTKRVVLGTLALATALALFFAFGWLPAWIWVSAMGLLAWSAALCYAQARAAVCVIFADRGIRNLDRGIEPVLDASLRADFRRTARSVHAVAAGVGMAAAGWAWIAASI